MDHDQTRRAFLLRTTGIALGVGSAEAFGGTDASTMNRRRNTVALTPQEIADRVEIEEVLIRYCYAVDDRDWDTYRKIFTPDAVIDDTVTGGVKSGVEEHVTYLTKALAKILISQHAISTTLIDLKGDEAKIRTHCSCPMVVDLGEGKRQVFFQGLWYRNRLVRTPEGWKIKELLEEGYWTHNLPTGFSF
jgi:SnoaL-like domain